MRSCSLAYPVLTPIGVKATLLKWKHCLFDYNSIQSDRMNKRINTFIGLLSIQCVCCDTIRIHIPKSAYKLDAVYYKARACFSMCVCERVVVKTTSKITSYTSDKRRKWRHLFHGLTGFKTITFWKAVATAKVGSHFEKLPPLLGFMECHANKRSELVKIPPMLWTSIDVGFSRIIVPFDEM